ncbi:retbindin [Petaurus breviceps papuanus]|uniref:retbindin n=1 Tax=Petaurus breviceps papuanus TaxID=3040969 RepID=UPI0036DA9BAC
MRGTVAWVLGIAWAMSLPGTQGVWAGNDGGAGSPKCLGLWQANEEPKFNGAPGWCGLHSTGSPIMAGICLIWDRCGGLSHRGSSRCESFLRSLSYFLHCSPLAVNWTHLERHGSIQALPICAAFCDQWFSACRDDLTCGRNWLSQPERGICEGGCLTFDQTFLDAKDLCGSALGDYLVAAPAHCPCLQLSISDPQPPDPETPFLIACPAWPLPRLRGHQSHRLKRALLLPPGGLGSGSGSGSGSGP